MSNGPEMANGATVFNFRENLVSKTNVLLLHIKLVQGEVFDGNITHLIKTLEDLPFVK